MAAHPDFEALVRDLRGDAPWRGSLLLGLVIAGLALILTWAALTEIDDVTRADGRVVPVRDVQVVQSAETAVLQRLHVREGDVVEAGALLMELDRTMLSSDFDQGQSRAFALMARIARLSAWINGAGTPDFPTEVVAASPGIVASERALFDADAAALIAEIEVLERQRIQRRQDQSEGRIEAETARGAVALVDDEIAIIAPLVARRVEPETSLLALRRTRAEAGHTGSGPAGRAGCGLGRNRRPDCLLTQPVAGRGAARACTGDDRSGRVAEPDACAGPPRNAVRPARARARDRQPDSPDDGRGRCRRRGAAGGNRAAG